MIALVPQVRDVAYAIFAAPDLDRMRAYLEDFGMVCAEQSHAELCMRGSGHAPFVHKTVLGPARFVGFGLEFESRRDIALLAARIGGELEDGPAMEASARLVVQDPDGWRIEAVHDWSSAPDAPGENAQLYNFGSQRTRLDQVRRVPQRPARVKRLGHIALKTQRLDEMLNWYRHAFCMRESDRFYIGQPDSVYLSEDHEAGEHAIEAVLGQWGPMPPADF